MALSAVVHIDGYPDEMIPVQLTIDAEATCAFLDGDGLAVAVTHPHLHNGNTVHVTFGDGAEAVGKARVANGHLTAIEGFTYRHSG